MGATRSLIAHLQAQLLSLSKDAATASAFAPDCRQSAQLLKELAPVLQELDEAQLDNNLEADCLEVLKVIDASMTAYSDAVTSCCRCGPLQTLLMGAETLHQLVDSCAQLGRALHSLQAAGGGTLPVLVQAQARMLAPQLEAVPVSYRTLHKLHRTLCELQDEAERVRCTHADPGTLHGMIIRLLASCPRQLLLSDLNYLQVQVGCLEASGSVTRTHFCKQAAEAVQQVLDDVCSDRAVCSSGNSGKASRSSSYKQLEQAQLLSHTEGSPAAGSRRAPLALRSRGAEASPLKAPPPDRLHYSNTVTPAANHSLARRSNCSSSEDMCAAVTPAKSLPAGVPELLSLLSSNVTPVDVRAQAVARLRELLDGQHEAVQVFVAQGGVATTLRQLQLSSSPPQLKLAALQLLERCMRFTAGRSSGDGDGRSRGRRGAAEESTEPGAAAAKQLVESRGLPALVFLLTQVPQPMRVAICQWQSSKTDDWDARPAWDQQALTAGHGVATLKVVGNSSSSSGSKGDPAAGEQQLKPVNREEDGGGVEAQLRLAAVAVLRRLAIRHAGDLVASGAVSSLVALLREGDNSDVGADSSAAAAAAAALADALHDGAVAVQALRDHALPALVRMLHSSRPVELASAKACLQALLAHCTAAGRGQAVVPPSPSPTPMDAASGNISDSLAGSMGRACCNVASVNALLDLLTQQGAGHHGRGQGHAERFSFPGALELLACAAASPDTRAAVLAHEAGMGALLRLVTEGSVPAHVVLVRAACEERTKPLVARQLARVLVAAMPPGARPSGRGTCAWVAPAACLARCLCAVLRPWPRPQDRTALRGAGLAAEEVVECGAASRVVALMASAEAQCRAAGVACAHAMCVYGGRSGQEALVNQHDVILHLIDCTKLEDTPLEPAGADAGVAGDLMGDVQAQSGAAPCPWPATLGAASVEALAALAGACEPWRRQIFSQLLPFLSSNSAALAAAACHALRSAMADVATAGQVLGALGVVRPVVALLSRVDGDALAILIPRAVQLLQCLCRSAAENLDAALGAGAVEALLPLAAGRSAAGRGPAPLALRLSAAAVLGQLLRRSEEARDQAMRQGGLHTLQELARIASGPAAVAAAGGPSGSFLPLWEEAMSALAALAGLHAPCRQEALQAMRQMLVRGGRGEAAAAACVVSRMATSTAGREAVLADALHEPLIKLLAVGDLRAKAHAAAALCHMAVPAQVTLPPCAALPKGGPLRPKVVLVRDGAVDALLALLAGAGDNAVDAADGSGSGYDRALLRQAQGQGPAALSTERQAQVQEVLVQAAEALECVAGCEEGAKAIRAAGGVEVLRDLVARAKRRETVPVAVPNGASKAASAVLLSVLQPR